MMCQTYICFVCFEELQKPKESMIYCCGKQMVEKDIFLADAAGHLLAREQTLAVRKSGHE